MIPKSYNEWKHCIVEKCKIPLTPQYIQSRMEALESDSSPESMKFRKLYGDEHFQQIKKWFEQALKDVQGENT